MSLELFKTNADICIRMAATAKTHEVRQQWNELAAHWHSKAEGYNKLQPQAAVRDSIKLIEVSPPISPAAPPPQPQAKPDAVVSEAPKPELSLVPNVAPLLVPRPEHGTPDAIWQEFRRFSGKSAPSPPT